MASNVISTEALIAKFKQAIDEEWGYIWGTAGESWTAAKQQAKVNYMVSHYGTTWKKNTEAKDDNYYKAALYGSKWIGHTVADCSGLFSWAFKKLGGYVAHGSNTIFRSYCKLTGKLLNGKRTDGLVLQPGTAVFVYNEKKNNYSHIGLYIGNGKVIEAAGTEAGVCMSNVSASKWEYWGELKGVSYGAEAPVNNTTDTDMPTIRKGSKGKYVIQAQTILYNLGYDLGSYGIDGDFGSATERAVKAFQSDHKLAQDGVVGKNTWAALKAAEAALNANPSGPLFTVTIHHLDKTQAEALRNNYPGCTVTEENKE